MTGSHKFCVFCGKAPTEKNREHVIPRWLIEHTGDPNRRAQFGFDFTKADGSIREYSFDQFTFPACTKCNERFSALEDYTKPVLLAMLEDKPLSEAMVTCLLDWLDKVRIGLWLGFLYLDGKESGIDPRFHIDTRFRAWDRYAVVYKLDTETTGINFFGPGIPTFLRMPCSFSLRINNYCLFNVSHFNLVDRRLGFPYAGRAFYKSMNAECDVEMEPGLGRAMYPVVRRSAIPFGVGLYQPLFPLQMRHRDYSTFYDAPYVRENCVDWAKGIGGVFIEAHGNIQRYPSPPTTMWVPSRAHPYLPFLEQITRQVLASQIDVLTSAASPDRMAREDRDAFKGHVRFLKKTNSQFLRIIARSFEMLKSNQAL